MVGYKALLQHLFELSFALDSQSAGKDYVALRKTHYDNQRWLYDKDLQEDYYQYFLKAEFGEEQEDG